MRKEEIIQATVHDLCLMGNIFRLKLLVEMVHSKHSYAGENYPTLVHRCQKNVTDFNVPSSQKVDESFKHFYDDE